MEDSDVQFAIRLIRPICRRSVGRNVDPGRQRPGMQPNLQATPHATVIFNAGINSLASYTVFEKRVFVASPRTISLVP